MPKWEDDIEKLRVKQDRILGPQRAAMPDPALGDRARMIDRAARVGGIVIPSIPDVIPAAQAVSESNLNANSAASLVANLQAQYEAWTRAMPADTQIVITVVLPRELLIRAVNITAVGQNGIAVEGEDNTFVLMHQSSFQAICKGEELANPADRRQIGFTAGHTAVEDPQ